MKKECKIILLPTKEESNVHLEHGVIEYYKNSLPNNKDNPQHIYITYDDEIKEDDWFYDYELNEIFRAGNTFITSKRIQQKKIIATTNKLIANNGFSNPDDSKEPITVHSISQSDIEYIISLYNGKSNSDKMGMLIDVIEKLPDGLGKEVDVEKLANGKCNKIKWVDQRERLAYYNGIRHGYNQCLQNNADKKFTLKDIKNVVEIFKEGWENKLSPDLDKVIKSLKERSSDTVIVEYEETTIFCDKSSKSYKWVSIPKLKDNQIIIHQT